MNAPVRLQGLPPLIAGNTRLLVLGSFPGATSLARQQYYAHPQNGFWRILQTIWPSSPHAEHMDSYEKRSAWILGRGLGVWDVYASCEREGSLDTAIRHPQVNDFADLQRRCPALQVIAHNGRDDLPPRTSHGRTVPAGLPLALHQSGQRQLEL